MDFTYYRHLRHLSRIEDVEIKTFVTSAIHLEMNGMAMARYPIEPFYLAIGNTIATNIFDCTFRRPPINLKY